MHPNIKVVVGKGETDLQEKLDDFFEKTRHITVQGVTQSSTSHNGIHTTTISILYSHNV